MCIRKWREYRQEKRNVKKLREAWLKRSGTMDYLWGKPPNERSNQ